jgi:hypothetical protein
MEIVHHQSALLSDFEVLALFCEDPATSRSKPATNVATMNYECRQYLTTISPSNLYTREHVASFMEAMLEFPLTRAEKLMLLNNRPTAPVHLYPVRRRHSRYLLLMMQIIEEVEIRFGEEGMEKLLEAINATLPEPPREQVEGEMEDDEGDDDIGR